MLSIVTQKVLPALTAVLRNLSDSTDLKAVLAKKIPEEQERVKNFRKAYGATKIGEVTVDMVSVTSFCGSPSKKYFLFYICVGYELLFSSYCYSVTYAKWKNPCRARSLAFGSGS
jgi:hypothetical protein